MSAADELENGGVEGGLHGALSAWPGGTSTASERHLSPCRHGPVVAQTSRSPLRSGKPSNCLGRTETRICKRDSSSCVATRRIRRNSSTSWTSLVRAQQCPYPPRGETRALTPVGLQPPWSPAAPPPLLLCAHKAGATRLLPFHSEMFRRQARSGPETTATRPECLGADGARGPGTRFRIPRRGP